jgi:hypothetical protein
VLVVTHDGLLGFNGGRYAIQYLSPGVMFF